MGMRNAFAILFAVGVLHSFAVAQPADRKPFRHVYYLFQESPGGCEACYIPLMVTRAPIDRAALETGPIENVVIVTFERDSIWQIATNSPPLDPAFVLFPERKLRWNGKSFRYQEVDREEALRLLRQPLGTIPISRRGFPGANSESLAKIQAEEALRRQLPGAVLIPRTAPSGANSESVAKTLLEDLASPSSKVEP
jgi:hypothetical protein